MEKLGALKTDKGYHGSDFYTTSPALHITIVALEWGHLITL